MGKLAIKGESSSQRMGQDGEPSLSSLARGTISLLPGFQSVASFLLLAFTAYVLLVQPIGVAPPLADQCRFGPVYPSSPLEGKCPDIGFLERSPMLTRTRIGPVIRKAIARTTIPASNGKPAEIRARIKLKAASMANLQLPNLAAHAWRSGK